MVPERMTFDSCLCSSQTGTETGSLRTQSPSRLRKWERMPLSNPCDKKGLFTVIKGKTDPSLPFVLQNIHHHQIPVRGERGCSIQQANPVSALKQAGSWAQLGGHSLFFIQRLESLWLAELTRRKVEENCSFSLPLDHWRCCLCRLFQQAPCTSVSTQRRHVRISIWLSCSELPFWRAPEQLREA